MVGGPVHATPWISAEVRAAYDSVASEYDRMLGDELQRKPMDRALLTAFAEMVGEGTIADVGCGPGHVSQFLAGLHNEVCGIDLSPGMVSIARERAPEIAFAVGSMLELPAPDGTWAGVVALYSVIHLPTDELRTACLEFARVLRPGGWLLVSFHVDSPDFATGEVNHLTQWFGQTVSLDGHFLDPDDVVTDLVAAGFTIAVRVERAPIPDVEYPSRRCYLMASTRS